VSFTANVVSETLKTAIWLSWA